MKKTLIYLFVGIVIMLTILVFTPLLFKDKILNEAKKIANKNVNAVVNFDNAIGLSLFKNFPDFTLTIDNISIVGVNEFQDDTLLYINSFQATLDLMSILKGKHFVVNEILLNKPLINALILKNGKANWDIIKTDTTTDLASVADTSESNFSLKLESFQITNANITFIDDESNINAVIENFSHQLKAEINNSEYALNMQNTIQKLSFTLSGIKYINNVNTKFDAEINANMDDMKFTFAKNELHLNALMLAFDGWFQMKDDDMIMDIKYNTPSSEFKHFISLIPAIYAKDFESVKSSGKLALSGYFKGIYNSKSYPQFDFTVNVDNGNFQYPGMPVAVSNVNIDFKAFNLTSNIEHTKVDFSKFTMQLGKDAFSAKFFAENLFKDPLIDLMVYGRVDLENIMKLLPSDETFSVSGIVAMDLLAKGNLSTIEKQQYQNFNASGNVSVNSLKYSSKDLPMPFYLNKLLLNFSTQKVSMPVCDLKIGNSDFAMNGELSNFFSYIFSDGTIKGNLNIKSNKIDANEFLAENTNTSNTEIAADTSVLESPLIPSNIDFTLNGNISQLIYTNMDITNFIGQIKVAESRLMFNNIQMQTLGASINMKGYYETTNPASPSMNMNFGIKNMDIQKAFSTFNTIQKLAPIAENMSGAFSTAFTMKTNLDKYLNPDLNTLYATGIVNISNAEIKNVKLFNNAADILKYDAIRQPSLKNVNIEFTVQDGRIDTKPFDVNLSGQKLTLSGSTGLDQTINYNGKTIVPKSALGVANTAVNSAVAKLNQTAGSNVKLPETIPVNLMITGTFSDPQIETDLSTIAKQESDNVKKQLLDQANRKKTELESQAKAELEKQKADLERQKKEAEAKAKAEYDKQKAEAEAKAKAEAEKVKKQAEAEKERLKKQAEEEAKKKLKGVFK